MKLFLRVYYHYRGAIAYVPFPRNINKLMEVVVAVYQYQVSINFVIYLIVTIICG